MIYKFKVAQVTEITAKNGNKFLAYKTVDKNGNFMDMKFVRNCPNQPTEKCWIYVLGENKNVDDNKEYPVLWIKKVERIEPLQVISNARITDKYFTPESEPAKDTAFQPF